MKLEFEQGTAIENPSNADIAEELPKVGGERGPFAILEESAQEYMQVGRSADDASKFTLEYREEGTQYQATEPVPLEEVVAAFQDFARGKETYKERHDWTELDLSASESGCLGSMAMVAALLLSILILAV